MYAYKQIKLNNVLNNAKAKASKRQVYELQLLGINRRGAGNPAIAAWHVPGVFRGEKNSKIKFKKLKKKCKLPHLSSPSAAGEMAAERVPEIALRASSGEPVLAGGSRWRATYLDFWASWCGPCRLMAPLMQWAASTYADRLTVGKLEADSNPGSRDAYKVQGLPTLILFRDGIEIGRHEGAMAKPQLQAFLDAHL